MPCHKSPKISCATKTAHSFYDWLIHYLQTKDYGLLIFPATLRPLLQLYKMDVHICLPYHSAMSSRRKRSSAPADSPAARKRMEELEPTPNICTYCPINPAFDPKRVLLRRLFFINEDGTKFVSVGFYPARHYLPLVEFGVLRRAGCPKTLILGDEQVDALAETLPTLRGDMCSGGARGCRCESGAFRLDVTRSGRTARLYVDSQFIYLTLMISDIYRACLILYSNNCVIISWHFKTCCPFVINTLTSVIYVEPSPDASKNVDFPLLYEELISFA